MRAELEKHLADALRPGRGRRARLERHVTAPQPDAGARQEPERRAEPLAEALEREGVVPAIVRIVKQRPPGVGAAHLPRPGDRRALPHGVHAAEPVLNETRRVAACTDRPEAEILSDVARDAGGGEAGG